MQVIPDIPLTLLMTLPFLGTFLALHFILFKPLLQYLEERESASVDVRAEAKRLDTDFEQRMAELEQRLVGAREEVADQLARARARAHEQESAILGEARQESDAKVSDAVKRIGAARKDAAVEMRTTASSLSTDIASQVLGRPVQA